MFHPSRARNATIIISKLNNFAEVLAVRVHVDVYMATPALRSLTHETLCDTTATATTTTTTYLPTTTPTKSHHFKPSILAFFAFGKKIIDGKNEQILRYALRQKYIDSYIWSDAASKEASNSQLTRYHWSSVVMEIIPRDLVKEWMFFYLLCSVSS